MAIAGRKETSSSLEQEQHPIAPLAIEPAAYQGIVIDAERTPISAIGSFIEGAPWSVNYYGQIIGEHNDVRELDVNEPNSYQQYKRIEKLEIRVTSDLAHTYEQTTTLSEVTGQATIYAAVVPNKADYFLAMGADQRVMVFRVSQVERMSFNRQAAYIISYNLMGYADVLTGITQLLEEKTIQRFVFNKDRLLEGVSPVLREEDSNTLFNLEYTLTDLVGYYFDTFFSKKVSTLILPGQDDRIYDHMLVSYLLKIISTNECLQLSYVKMLPSDGDPFLKQPTLWTAMIKRDISVLSYCNTQMKLIDKVAFTRLSYGRGAGFYNVEYFVYPTDPDLTAISNGDFVPKDIGPTLGQLIPTKNRQGGLANSNIEAYTNGTVSLPTIHPVLYDNYYVLSGAFYAQQPTCSVLESLVLAYLRRTTIDLKQLKFLVDSYKTWARLEQYYYGPLLFTLIKQTRSEVY